MTDAVLDTSFIVRYLSGDPAKEAETAARVIDGEERLGVTSVALVESAYVLSKAYGVPREQVVDALVQLLQRENVVLLGPNKATMIEALLLCRPSGRVTYADAAIWAHARSAQIPRIYSFDRRFPAEGVQVERGERA